MPANGGEGIDDNEMRTTPIARFYNFVNTYYAFLYMLVSNCT